MRNKIDNLCLQAIRHAIFGDEIIILYEYVSKLFKLVYKYAKIYYM